MAGPARARAGRGAAQDGAGGWGCCWGWPGPQRGRLAGAALAGAAATGCGVALLGVSGFLLARASQHPNIVAISVAVVAVRGLSVGRAVFRYLERLGTHDIAFRVLATVRVAIYRRLERLAPAGLGAFRSGDLLARLVSDVDATQDLFIRGLAPPLAAVLVGAAASAAALAIRTPAGGVLAAGLIIAGVAVPWLCARTAALAARRTAPARGELGAALTDALAGSSELIAFGAERAALVRVTDADAELTRLARRTAGASGLGTGLSSLLAGATLWAVLLLGVAATGGGTLGRVPLAVITLTALAAFEAVTVLPAAAIQLGQSSAAAARIGAVLDAPDPVAEPAAPAPVPDGAVTIGLHEISVRYRPDGPLALDGFDLDLRPGRRVALLGPTGSGKSTVAAVLLRFAEPSGGTATLNGAALGGYAGDDVRTADPRPGPGRARLRHHHPGQPADRRAAGRRRRSWPARWPRSRSTTGWARCRSAWTRRSGRTAPGCPAGSASASRWPVRCCPLPPVLVLDEPIAHLDPAARGRITADLLAPEPARATLLITHDLTGLEQADEIIVLADGRVAERGSHAGLLEAGGWYARMRLSAGLS